MDPIGAPFTRERDHFVHQVFVVFLELSEVVDHEQNGRLDIIGIVGVIRRQTVGPCLTEQRFPFFEYPFQAAQQTLWLGMTVAVASAISIVFLFMWVRREESAVVSLAVAGAAGSLTNTAMVLSAATLRGYVTGDAAWGIAITHGIPEMFVSAIVTAAVVAAIRQVGTRRGARL